MYKYITAVVVLLAIILPVTAVTITFAQGDPFFYPMDQPGGSCWFFSNNVIKNTPYYFDLQPMIINGVSTCHLSSEQTGLYSAGSYTLIYEQPANLSGKYIRDVTWKDYTFVPMLASSSPRYVNNKLQSEMLRDLKEMITEDAINTYTEYGIIVQNPFLTLNSVSATANNIYTVSGTCNLAGGTIVTIKIDKDLPNTPDTKKSFEFTTKVENDNIHGGHWNSSFILPIDDMAPGWHDVDAYARDMHASVRFPLYRGYSDQVIRNDTINYFGNGSIAPITITIPVTVIQTQIVELWHTATPTPDITDILGTKVDYQSDPQEKEKQTITYGTIAVAALVVCLLAMVLRRKI
jgi:hypothetical protein